MRTKWNFPVASFIIGVVLGPMTENSIRQSLMMFKGDMTRIFDRPIALTFLFVTMAFIIFKISYPFLRRKFSHREGF
jgi:putative tricarboxylic transport membrane protein